MYLTPLLDPALLAQSNLECGAKPNALWMRYEHPCTELQVGAGGFMVLRPDSGDPVEAVLMALRAAEKVLHLHTCQLTSYSAITSLKQTFTTCSCQARTCNRLLSRTLFAWQGVWVRRQQQGLQEAARLWGDPGRWHQHHHARADRGCSD
jgi:hypothetical protein